ncbi:MAG TPA: 50S ribosomal protein L10 [Gemmatimonadaceae bacterium]|jgi:large subunit ribosomal protein L10
MKRSDKEELVRGLKKKMEGADALYYTDFTGLNVKRMTELRRSFRKAGVEYVVIKNSLALRAVNESGLAAPKLKGPTGVVIAKDAIAAAKLLTEFARKNEERPSVKGGLYEGASIDGALVKKLALMPTRDEALGQFLGYLNSVLSSFAGVLEARKVQLEASAPPAEGAPASAPETASAESIPQASA